MSDESKQGDRFVRLYAAHEPAIRAFVRRLVVVREDARDVMQDVAVVLWRKFDSSLDGTEFRKWAFWVARNEVLAWRRDKARDRHVLDEDVLMLLADEAMASDEVLSAQRDALKGCLERLAEPQRRLLLAAYATKGGVQQVAKQSGRSTHGFYQWLYRVRHILLDCIRETIRRTAT